MSLTEKKNIEELSATRCHKERKRNFALPDLFLFAPLSPTLSLLFSTHNTRVRLGLLSDICITNYAGFSFVQRKILMLLDLKLS